MALPATEVFTDANGTALVTHSANWTLNAGNFSIQTNALAGNAAAAQCGAFWNADTFGADQYAQAVLAAKSATVGADIGVGVRHAIAGTANYYGLVYSEDAGVVQIIKVVAGVRTVLGADFSGVRAVNDVLRLEVVGTTLTYKLNGVSQGTRTDSTFATGAAGVVGLSNDTLNRIDTWEGGNLGGVVVGSTGTRRVGNARGPYDRRGFINRAVWETMVVAAVAAAVTITPDTGLLQLDGFAPTFPTTVSPGTGALTLTGNAPTFPVLVVPGSGALSLSGFAPTLGVPQTIVPGVGSLVLTGAAPTFPTTLLPGSGALVLNGLAPTIGTPVTVVAGFGQLTLSGLAPTFPRTILPGAGALTLSGFSPTFPYTLRPGLGALVLDGFAGSFGPLGSITLQPGFGQLSLTGFAPTIGVPVTVVPGLGALSLSGQAPTFPVTRTIGFGQLTLTGFDPAFTFTPLFLSRAIAQSDATVIIAAGLSRTITVAQNTGIILIRASDSKTIALGTTQNATVSIDSED